MSRNRHVIVSALGVTQILAWGSSFYLPAVLAAPTAADMGWSLPSVVAGLSCGLLLAGLVSPIVGRLIQNFGGRPVLAGSSLLFASALALMAMASTYLAYLFAWLLMGLGMASGLYDAGFATLGRLYGQGARSAITTLTLFGGFASTVCWPVSAFLVENFGWRAACFAYAAVHLFICPPLHLGLVPAPPVLPAPSKVPEPENLLPAPATSLRATFALLALILALSAFLMSVISVHLLEILQARGLDLAVAVGLGALIGPSQVGARMVEMFIGRNRHHPKWTMLAASILIACGVGMLMIYLPLTTLALILYGAGNGIHTIARGALPLVIFDPRNYASIMGKLATPSLVVQAVAPSVGAVLLGFGETVTLGVLLFVALSNVFLVGILAFTTRR